MDYKNMSNNELYLVGKEILEKGKEVIDKEFSDMTREEKRLYIDELLKPEMDALMEIKSGLLKELAKDGRHLKLVKK